MDRQDLEILRRVPLFADLAEPQLAALLRDVSVRDHPKGQLLFLQDDRRPLLCGARRLSEDLPADAGRR